MNVTFRQLRVFLALAETGSVSATARAMHVTQPTVSVQLREISEAVGLLLYEVVGRKLFLTEAGHRLAAAARTMAQVWEAFGQEVDALKGLSRGRLRLAVVSTAKYFMPRLVGSFCRKHPGIDVSLEILNRDGVVLRLRENLDDFYIMSMPPADIDLSDEVLMANPLVVIAPAADPLARDPLVPLRALAGRRFILREKGSGTRMAVDRHFRSVRFRPDVRMELGSNEAVKESVAGGLGLGVISRHALHGHQRENGVRILNVEGFPLPSVWHIVHPASRKLSPVALAFKQHVLREVSKRAETAAQGFEVPKALTRPRR
jgi:DNA-binding transcriptional LysR family regulator